MNIYAWIGLGGIIVFSFLPLLKEENRTKSAIRYAVLNTFIVIAIILAFFVLQISFILALLVGFIMIIIFDKKTYTKKRLIIYGSILLVVSISIYVITRNDPDYVVDHLKENPETTSLYVNTNGENTIRYQADKVRPLASTVKIVIALEYATQVAANKIVPESKVALDQVNRYYLRDTDGGAHSEWLKNLEEKGKIKDETVTLHQIAKGMITYSSNAHGVLD